MNWVSLKRRGYVSVRWASFPVVAGVALLLVFAVNAKAQTHSSPLPAPTGYVNDYANVIEAQRKAQLETILTNLKERANIEIAVVTVATTNGEEIFDYSLAVARSWGIGSKGGDKAGLLLLVAINDRKYFTQVSDHLEGDLPDGLVGTIQRERLVPQFKRGDYSQGIYDTVQAYIATLAEKRGFNIEGIDKRYAYGGEIKATPPERGKSSSFPCCIIIVIIFIIIFVLSSIRRGGHGGGGGGFGSLLNMFLLGSLINTVTSGGRSSSGWSSGGFGGSGGGGGFGGFGGGGSFGGGGAGGGW